MPALWGYNNYHITKHSWYLFTKFGWLITLRKAEEQQPQMVALLVQLVKTHIAASSTLSFTTKAEENIPDLIPKHIITSYWFNKNFLGYVNFLTNPHFPGNHIWVLTYCRILKKWLLLNMGKSLRTCHHQ